MIRKPTPIVELYRWHTAALSGKRPAYHDGDIHCGWYRRRFVKHGPWVPARLWCEQIVDAQGLLIEPEFILCEVRGERRNASEQFPWLASNPISKETFENMEFKIEWAEQTAPNDPILFPYHPVPIAKSPTRPGDFSV